MLRATFSILALSLLSHTLQAQFTKSIIPKLSIQVEAGYGRSLPVEYLYEIRESRAGIDLVGKYFDLAGGLQLGLGLGYDLNTKFRIILQGQYQQSPKLKLSNYRFRSTGGGINSPPVLVKEPQSFSFNTLSISSLVQYNLGNLGKTWQAFFNFGPSLYVLAQATTESTYFSDPSTIVSITEMKMNAGLTSSIGIEKKLGSKLTASMALQIRASYFNNHSDRAVKEGDISRRGTTYYGTLALIEANMSDYDFEYYSLYPILSFSGENSAYSSYLTNEVIDRSLNFLGSNILFGLTYHL